MQKSDEAIDHYVPRVRPFSRTHRIRGVEYHVSEWGDRRDRMLVALHGWGDCGEGFQFFVDSLERRWFVIAPDWRGFGRSAGRAHSYWFPDYLADLDALLACYTPDQPALLIGHSMGANVAGLYAGVMPERVSAFINVEGFGLRDKDPADAPDNYRRWIEAGRSPRPYASYASYGELASRIQSRSPALSRQRALFVAQLWGVAEPDGTVRLRADPAHKLPNPVLYRRNEALACWAQIRAQVLLVSGADSAFAADAANWPGTGGHGGGRDRRAVIIPGSGHMLHFEQPERLAAAAEAFLVNTSSTG